MRIEAEHPSPAPFRRTVLDHADGGVTVFHRRREIALLEGAAHGLVLVLGHPAGEDEALGAAADAAGDRAHEHLAGTRRRERRAASTSVGAAPSWKTRCPGPRRRSPSMTTRTG